MNKILVVDDNEENLYMLNVLLSANGFNVEQATNGIEALKTARRAPPDMVISDILMPEMDGFSLCREWNMDDRLRSIPFIFYTATYTAPEDEEFALSLGATKFIIKPNEPESFMAMIKDTMNNYKGGKKVIPAPQPKTENYYKEYNATLIRKLEDKMLQLETANRVLEAEIIERKRTEAELRKLHQQIIQARKMESVGRLAGGIAHDFNNMLTVIIGSVDLAMIKLTPEDPIYARLKEIRTATERSTGLIKQLLALASQQPATPKVLHLNEILSGMLKMLRYVTGEKIETVWSPGENLWTVMMDPSQIDQILVNLCVNARDAINKNGRIIIKTRNEELDSASAGKHGVLAPGEYVKLSVQDDGCGMDNETLTYIFDPFFTTKSADAGTGLGLATVYGIVKQYNGHINVFSEINRGTLFEIYLPRHHPRRL